MTTNEKRERNSRNNNNNKIIKRNKKNRMRQISNVNMPGENVICDCLRNSVWLSTTKKRKEKNFRRTCSLFIFS